MNAKIIVVTLFNNFYATSSNVVSSIIWACNFWKASEGDYLGVLGYVENG
jgi:hypothetical protein